MWCLHHWDSCWVRWWVGHGINHGYSKVGSHGWMHCPPPQPRHRYGFKSYPSSWSCTLSWVRDLPPENMIKAMNFTHVNTHTLNCISSHGARVHWPCRKHGGWGEFGTAHSDFTAFEHPACCVLSLWGCAGLGKQLANILFKVKKINSTGDMLCFLICSVERNEVQCNQGRGGRKGRDWSEGKSFSL